MRKRGRHIQHKAKSAPGMLAQAVQPDYEIRLRSAANAFRAGYASGEHHSDLCDTADMMLLAMKAYTQGKPDIGALAVVELAGVALTNIRERHQDTGRVGATGEELHALHLLVETSLDFWNRHSGALYAFAYQQLRRVRRRQVDEYRKQQEAA